jgi:hypothetical protein
MSCISNNSSACSIPWALFEGCDEECETSKCETSNNWNWKRENCGFRIDLDNGYWMEIDERNSQVTIHDKSGQVIANINGDGNVDTNGDGIPDFKISGPMTFALGDGTKITINTRDIGNGMYQAENIVITKGEKSLIVNGVASYIRGDLRISKGMNGCALDAAVWDGNLVVSQDNQGNWVDDHGNKITQAEANKTKPSDQDPKELSYKEESKLLKSKSDPCAPKYSCMSWLEAVAVAMGQRLQKLVLNMSRITELLQLCNTIGAKGGMTADEMEKLYKLMSEIGDYTGTALDKGSKEKFFTKGSDGLYTANKEATKWVDAAAVILNARLTAASQQFNIESNQTMTVVGALGKGLETLSRAI